MGQFYIQSSEDSTLFASFFGDGAAIITEGYAGWNVIERPRDIGIVEWQGRNPMAIEIPFHLNYYYEEVEDNPGIQCEAMVRNLEVLCGVGGHQRPPVCRISGNSLIPHDEDAAGLGVHWWVIEQVSWERDQEVRSNVSGRRLMCGGTIVIRQFLEARDIMQRISPTARAQKPKHYRVQRGDNLSKIAAKMYGNANKWKVIADANNLRDRRRIYVGQLLRIPSL